LVARPAYGREHEPPLRGLPVDISGVPAFGDRRFACRLVHLVTGAGVSAEDVPARAITSATAATGTAGLELAGQIAELARDTLRREFRTIVERHVIPRPDAQIFPQVRGAFRYWAAATGRSRPRVYVLADLRWQMSFRGGWAVSPPLGSDHCPG